MKENNNVENWINEYLNTQIQVIKNINVDEVNKMIEVLRDALLCNTQIFVCGNGGSASNTSHFVTDLGKGSSDVVGKRFKVLSLNENLSWITAIGNDYSYEDIFVRQLENYTNKGDILFTLGVSGSSPNVVKAVKWAKKNGLYTMGLVGKKGGKIKELVDQCIVVDDFHYGRVEDTEMIICHLLCYVFMELNKENKD